MHDVFDLFEHIRARASSENDRLAAAFRLASGDARISALNIIHQQATISAELLSHYMGWMPAPAHTPADVERAQLESAQRVISLSKAAFILSISAVEFSAKHAVADHPHYLTVPQGRVYLRDIIQESARAGMISRHMEHGWSGILELRNMLVHNNAIAERTQAFELPGGPTLALTEGRMMHGNLRLLPEVLLWTTNAFAAWSGAFLGRVAAA